MRTCKKCLRSLDEGEFYYGETRCKECERARTRRYANANPEKVKEATRKWRAENREELNEYKRKYRAAHPGLGNEADRAKVKANPEKYKAIREKWRMAHRETVREKNRDYARRCRVGDPGKYNERSSKWKRDNPEKVRETARKWRMAHREEIRERRRKYSGIIRKWRIDNAERIKENMRKRYATDPAYRLKIICRARIAKAIQGLDKSASTRELIGCTWEELRRYIESLFTKGMHWNNQGTGPGKWHIDHIEPFANYPNMTPAEQKIVCNWRNLRPIWSKENLKKSGNFSGTLRMLEC